MTPIEIALKEYGKKDISGPQSNPEVLKYFTDIGALWIKDDDTPWCAAFVSWVLKQAGKTQNGSLLARSFLSYGDPVDVPQLGDLVVLWRIAPSQPFGHVGFFIRETPTAIYILGGNQADQVNITAFSKNFLIAYRRP